MREVDPAPIRARLDLWSGAARASTAQQKLVERWRERLLAEDDALALFAAEYAGCDLQRLRSLVASVKRDTSLKRTPKNYRELFRLIRDIVAAKREAVKEHGPAA
jgi:ribosome-associated protein